MPPAAAAQQDQEPIEDGSTTWTVPDSLVTEYRFRLPRSFEYSGIVWPGMIITSDGVENVKHFQFKDTDVLICSYPKTGTTWTSEVVSMVAYGADEAANDALDVHQRVHWMECGDHDVVWAKLQRAAQSVFSTVGINVFGSPAMDLATFDASAPRRLFFTHVPAELLPEQVLQGKVKVVYVNRNPKDTLVSFYHHHKIARFLGMQALNSWDEFFAMFMAGKLYNGCWFEHTAGMYKLCQQFPDQFLVVRYEDMKQDLATEVGRVGSFLDERLTPEQQQRVVQHCTFEHMAQNSAANRHNVVAFQLNVGEFMRKGEVGDWMNYFTVAQSEMMDERLDRFMATRCPKWKPFRQE